MAVATEVAAWRRVEADAVRVKKRAWGADAQQLMQLTMGQMSHSPGIAAFTLDLLGNGKATGPSFSGFNQLESTSAPELKLELDSGDAPVPSGWEKCLDLKTGKLFLVNKNSDESSFGEPCDTWITESVCAPLAHEFLSSKESEKLKQDAGLRVSSSSSSGSLRDSDGRQNNCSHLLSSSGRKQLWNLNGDDCGLASLSGSSGSSPKAARQVSMDLNLELDLNLSTGASAESPIRRQEQAVCTMEMIQNALKRVEEKPSRPRLKQSLSSTFSSLISPRSEPSGASPSTSSSSASSKSTLRVDEAESVTFEPNAIGSSAYSLVMGACTRCLMYVMLNRGDPRCPRCNSQVPVDFSAAPPSKRLRHRGDQQFRADRR
ncbi:uncharacterized protein [Physcomitrium patens]|uniref:WW domain-containing protein n=1 Tax=Physcomitrium patens TaxID=3218 RepID=A0A2K1L0W9_PHYPA|nr:uncharacterized protein LOC112273467 [Physcomitrium patens]PNR59678.1 hypothetical protein PHYPA_002470 [Physcomitrium patens]|eukprot:XP_024358073.1 uncharacterized protein LOC112273467 [Physcomitrella patens]